MSARSPRTPSYRLHAPSGQAVVTLDGRDFDLGRHGTPESHAEYDRLIAEWLANGRRLPPGEDLTIAELIVRYLGHVDRRYTSDEPAKIRLALRPVRELYGLTLAREFGPLRLKTVRQRFVDQDLVRGQVNKRVRRIVQMFRWAVAEELLRPDVHQALKAVEGLRKGRGDVREGKPVKPVPDAWVDPIRPCVSRQVWTMVELQRLTGMRPGEVCAMRTIDVNTAGRIWEYVPESRKTEHHENGRGRTIFIGPRAQSVLSPWLRAELEAPLFQPREAVAEHRARQREARKTKVQPSQQDRRKTAPRKRPGERYDATSYRRAIVNGIAAANRERAAREEAPIPNWHPHRLRHSAGTRPRREFGLDTARAVLGHSTPVVTESYAEIDRARAVEAMKKLG
ncbi:MAG TPA: site-specific integrase [Isosphaeraceae bacterium]|nr:site-specific integrase [Isosphaeraceae bacterium]